MRDQQPQVAGGVVQVGLEDVPGPGLADHRVAVLQVVDVVLVVIGADDPVALLLLQLLGRVGPVGLGGGGRLDPDRQQADAAEFLRVGHHADLAGVPPVEQDVHAVARILDDRTVVADRGPARLPGHRVLVAPVPGRVRHQRACVLVEVDHRVLVERGQPAVVDQVAERRAVVGHHDDVVAGVLLCLQRRPDLGIEGEVVADRLGVVDLDAGELGEVLKRRVLALEHVDVVRPVREVDRVVQLLLGPPLGRANTAGLGGAGAGRRRALHAAGGEERRHAERARAGPGGPQHLAAGHAPLRHAAPDGRVDHRVAGLRPRIVLILHRSSQTRPVRAATRPGRSRPIQLDTSAPAAMTATRCPPGQPRHRRPPSSAGRQRCRRQ